MLGGELVEAGMNRFARALASSFLWIASAASGEVTLDAQQRSVEADSVSEAWLWQTGSVPLFPDFDPPTDTIDVPAANSVTATDFSPFVESAATSDPPIVILPFGGSASSDQDSTLSTSSIEASGSFANAADAFFLEEWVLAQAEILLMPPQPFIFGIGASQDTSSSVLEVDFTVDAPTQYELSGDLALSAPVGFATAPVLLLTTAQAVLELRDSGGIPIAGTTIDQSVSVSANVADSRLLLPGSYTLVASVAGTSVGGYVDVIGLEITAGSASGSFDATLALTPVPNVPSLPVGAVPVLWLALASLAVLRLRVGTR